MRPLKRQEKQKKTVIPTIDTEQADSNDFKAKLTSVMMVPCSVLLPMQPSVVADADRDQTSYDDQASQLDYNLAGTMRNIRQIKYQKTEQASFGRLTDEQKEKDNYQPTSTGTGLWYQRAMLIQIIVIYKVF